LGDPSVFGQRNGVWSEEKLVVRDRRLNVRKTRVEYEELEVRYAQQTRWERLSVGMAEFI
jgi:hypothetical protein